MTETIPSPPQRTAAEVGDTPVRHQHGDATRLEATRRLFLAGGVALAGVGVLAACSSAGGTPAAGGGGSSGGTATGGASAGLVAVADVPVGGAVSAKDSAGQPIIVAQPTAGTVVAFSAICTHMGCVVEPKADKLVCPCHGSVFQAASGANLSGPAPSPLPPVQVTVKDGQVVQA
ncbi:MAG TPA: Rieske (2Fe-2S) protein [Actinotalea sp.]